MDRRNPDTAFIKDLWDRRFFQYFAAYLGSAWALIQFCEWLVSRYGFRDLLVDRLALMLLICLPAFLVFVYNHGRPGPDKWLPFEKIFIPFSILLSIVLGFIFIQGDKGSFDYVEVEDLNGDTLKRYVPIDNNFRFVGIFPFENKLQDDTNKYLNHAIPELIDFDLLRDSRVYPVHPYILYKNSDFTYEKYFSGLSFSEKLKTAKAQRTNYFLTGSFQVLEDLFLFKVEVYETKTGKTAFEKDFQGNDIFDIVDNITLDLIGNLFPKELYPQSEVIDLPASDLISSNLEAINHYINGNIESQRNPSKPSEAIPYFEKALAFDPDCSPCHYELANSKILNQGFEAGLENLEMSVSLSSYLYDRMRFEFQERLYEVKADNSSRVKLLKLMIRLYPKQLSGYTRLMDYYEEIDIVKAIEVGLDAVANGFAGRVNFRLGNLYYLNGEYSKSRDYFQAHIENFPNEIKAKQSLIETYTALGEYESASQLLEENTLLNPNSSAAFAQYAEFQRRFKGKFELGEELLKESLVKANSKKDSSDIYYKLSILKNQTGQIEQSIEYLNLSKQLDYQIEIALIVDFTTFGHLLNIYWEIDSLNEITEIKDAYISEHSKIIPLTECLLNLSFAEIYRDTSLFMKYYPSYRDSIRAFYGENNNIHLYYDAILEAFKGNDCEAVQQFYGYYDTRGIALREVPDIFIHSAIECGALERARELVDGNLKSSPHWAYYHFLSAKVSLLEGDQASARTSLEKALEVLQNADESHKVFNMAKELYQSLQL